MWLQAQRTESYSEELNIQCRAHSYWLSGVGCVRVKGGKIATHKFALSADVTMRVNDKIVVGSEEGAGKESEQ